MTRSVEKLHLSVNSAIMKFGHRVVDRQLMLQRYADCAIDIYGMLAVISRVTGRLEEVGPKEAQIEQDIARIFCEGAWNRVRRNLRQIRRHEDRPVRRLSDHVAQQGWYNFPL